MARHRAGPHVSGLRWRSCAGIVGPAVFIAAWSTQGAIRAGYSPVHDPISRLAALGASTRPAMTAGFVAFAAGVGAYTSVLQGHHLRGAARAATLTAAATLGVAVLPLGGTGGDHGHAIAAGIAYAALAATPLLACGPLARRGARTAAVASIFAGVTVAGALAASVVLPSGAGLAQRVGLTIGDLWIMSTALQFLGVSGARESRCVRLGPRFRGRRRRVSRVGGALVPMALATWPSPYTTSRDANRDNRDVGDSGRGPCASGL